jgi:hypothetical protein
MVKFSGTLAGHSDDHDLERYRLGEVTDEAELGPLEEHLLWCGGCVERAEAIGAVRGCCPRRRLATCLI